MEVPSKQELLCVPKKTSSPPSPTTLQWGRAVAEVKEHAVAKLQEELKRAHEELKLKDEEVARLSRIRQDIEAELEELTASLFQVSLQFYIFFRQKNERLYVFTHILYTYIKNNNKF